MGEEEEEVEEEEEKEGKKQQQKVLLLLAHIMAYTKINLRWTVRPKLKISRTIEEIRSITSQF